MLQIPESSHANHMRRHANEYEKRLGWLVDRVKSDWTARPDDGDESRGPAGDGSSEGGGSSDGSSGPSDGGSGSSGGASGRTHTLVVPRL